MSMSSDSSLVWMVSEARKIQKPETAKLILEWGEKFKQRFPAEVISILTAKAFESQGS